MHDNEIKVDLKEMAKKYPELKEQIENACMLDACGDFFGVDRTKRSWEFLKPYLELQ